MNNVEPSLADLLMLMVERLKTAQPKCVDAKTVQEWCVFTDTSYDNVNRTGGLGAVLVGANGERAGCLSLKLDCYECCVLGSFEKDTIIYELELLGGCVALDLWASTLSSSYPMHYGYNDSVRFALIRGTGLGLVAENIMNLHLRNEVSYSSNVWFARVPTEANIAVIFHRGSRSTLSLTNCKTFQMMLSTALPSSSTKSQQLNKN